MPMYDFECHCGHAESKAFRMSTLPAGNLKCPRCGKKKLARLFGVPNVKTSKTLRTFGQQSEANIKAVGKEGMEFMERDYQKKRYEGRVKAMEEMAAETGGKPMKIPKRFKEVKEDPKLKKHVNKTLGKKDPSGGASDAV